MRRSVIASSTLSNHQFEMFAKFNQFRVRGYSSHSLTVSLGFQKPEIWQDKAEYKRLRKIWLKPKEADKATNRVVAPN